MAFLWSVVSHIGLHIGIAAANHGLVQKLLAYSQSTQRWGMLLYMNSPFSSFPDGTDYIEKARILQNIKRAVWHLGYEADQSQISRAIKEKATKLSIEWIIEASSHYACAG